MLLLLRSSAPCLSSLGSSTDKRVVYEKQKKSTGRIRFQTVLRTHGHLGDCRVASSVHPIPTESGFSGSAGRRASAVESRGRGGWKKRVARACFGRTCLPMCASPCLFVVLLSLLHTTMNEGSNLLPPYPSASQQSTDHGQKPLRPGAKETIPTSNCFSQVLAMVTGSRLAPSLQSRFQLGQTELFVRALLWHPRACLHVPGSQGWVGSLG